MTPSVLFVLSSADQNLLGKQTGWYLPEAAHPYYVLLGHANIDFASLLGADPPVDKGSVETFKDDSLSTKFLNDNEVGSKLSKAKKLSDVSAKDYDAIFYVGGHGPVLDLPSSPVNAQLASDFWQQGKIVAAVCHGSAALVGARDEHGKSIFHGRSVTGFSDKEEEIMGLVLAVPFSLEGRLTYLGGKFEKADEPWAPKVVVDGRLITGQNPASATGVGEALLKALRK